MAQVRILPGAPSATSGFSVRERTAFRCVERAAATVVPSLPNGSFRAVVSAATDPLTRWPRYFRETVKRAREQWLDVVALEGLYPRLPRCRDRRTGRPAPATPAAQRRRGRCHR